MTHSLLVALFTLVLLPALGMVFIPLFPTFWYLIAAASFFGFIDGFIHLTLANLIALGGVFLASIVVDWSAGLLGAKFGGAGWKSIFAGAIGGAVGFVIAPPLGAFAGLFFGVLVGEVLRRRKSTEAVRAASGALLGSLAGIIVNALLALAFIALFLYFAL